MLVNGQSSERVEEFCREIFAQGRAGVVADLIHFSMQKYTGSRGVGYLCSNREFRHVGNKAMIRLGTELELVSVLLVKDIIDSCFLGGYEIIGCQLSIVLLVTHGLVVLFRGFLG